MSANSPQEASLPAPTSSDVAEGKELKVSQLQNKVFHLTIKFPGMKKGDYLQYEIIVSPDRFSPPVKWFGPLTTNQDDQETFEINAASFFGYDFKDGSAYVSYSFQNVPSASLSFTVNN